jgi:glycosyltransferase involved in cell wall biosynthesis
MLFVVPGPDAPVSGGNRYNDALIAELGARRVQADALDRFALEDELGAVWVDSLYLALLPRIRARASHARAMGLLAHSLPSTLAQAAGEPEPLLEVQEAAWLGALDLAVAPSETMRGWLRARAPALRVCVVQPGVVGAPPAKVGGPLQAVMVANLTANKGVLPFLEQLARRVRAADAFTLRIVGRVDLDPAYASRCRAFTLDGRVTFTDGMPFPRLLGELARAHVLVSASRLESYGMAIAEARACGCLVLAHEGGHVSELVDAASGRVLPDDAALAGALLELARCDHVTLPPAWPARSWHQVAREFRTC